MGLAQMQIQAFAMNMQAMELHRLADGRLSGGMGIAADDTKMIERAEKLADAIDKQYAPALAEGNKDMKRMLLRQTVSAFETTYRAATEQYLYDDTEHERLQLLGGKAGEMLSLYLAAQFDRYRARPEYTQTFSAAEKAQAGAYKYFLDHLPPEVAAVTRDLELFKRRLDGLAPLQSVEAIREGLKPLHEEFARLVKLVTGEEIPNPDELKKEKDKQSMANGRLLSAVGSFQTKAQLFSYLNQLEVYVDQYASSNLVWSRSDTFWTQAAKFKWLDAAFNKMTFGYREVGVNFVMGSGLMGVIRPKWHEAYMKLKADTGMRDALKQAMRDGDDQKMLEIAAKLDPEAAERAVRMAKLDKLDQDPSDSLNLDGLLAKRYDNDLQAAAFGATVARFKLLQPLMTSYAASSALVDTGISIVATAVGGPLIAYVSDVPGRLNAYGLGLKARGAEAFRNAEGVAKLLGGGKYVAGAAIDLATDNYATRVLQNTGRSIRQHLDLPTGAEERQGSPLKVAVSQIAKGQTWKSAFNATWEQVKMMGVIQVGMTEFDYMTTPASAQSQYSSAWDAAVQGFFQGLAFGGKMAVMNHFSPFPATAFQGRFLGRFGIGGFVRKLAESAGPVSWAVQSIAQTIPATAESVVAKQGIFGALQSAGMTAGAGSNFAARFGVHVLGQVDGMLKYVWLAGTLPKAVSEVGYMFSSDKDWKTGWTGAAVGAVAAGGAALVGSLLFKGIGRGVALPLALAGGLGGLLATVQNKPTDDTLVNPRTGTTAYMARLSETHFVSQNISQLAWLLLPTNPAFSPTEMRSQVNSAKAFNALIAEGRGMEIANAPNDYPLTIEKDLTKRSLWDILTRKPVTDTLIVNEQWRAQAWEHEMKRMSESELLAIADAPLKEGAGQILELRDYLDGARDPEAFKKRLEENVANPGRDKAISVEIKVGGKWERVDLSDPNARARWVPGAAPGDGYVEVKHPRTLDWVRVGTDAETPLARPVFGGRPDQVRLSIESVAAARTELERRLTDKPELREQLLLTAESGKVVLPGGLEVRGDQLGGLRETAARIEVTNLPFSLTAGEFFSRFGRASWTDGKLDGQMERIGRILRDHVSGETARLAKSTERYGELGEQARQMAETVKLPGDRALFKEVADALLADKPDAKAAREALEKGVAEKLALGEKAEGVPARSLQIMLRGLNGEQTADLMTMAAHRVMAKQMGEGGAALDDALKAISRDLGERDKKAGPPTADDVYKISLDALSAKGLREAAPQAADRLLKGLEADRAAVKDPKNGQVLLEAVQRRLLAEAGAGDAALGLLRKAMEGDAVRQAVAQRGLDAARNGDEKAIGDSIDLLLDVWERGVFGQLVGERVLVKDKDGKEELQWTIPKEVAFYNRFKQSIPSFRALQREVLREGLMLVMQGHPLVFGQMPTAGGKTLTMFVAIEYLKADARNKGRENVILLTTNPDLIAQAKDDYLGFFGKKPDFEIMTVGDLSAQIAQAKAQGMPDPTLKNHLVIDEADKYAAEVPTSVGVFNGAMTMPEINPVLKALTKETRHFVDAKDGFFAKHYDAKDGHVREGRFAELMAKDPKFKADFEAAVARAEASVDDAFEHMKSREFRDELAAPGPDSPLSKAPEYLVAADGDRDKAAAEIQKILVAEFKHARSSGISLYGSYEKDLSLMFQGAFQWASSPEKEMVGIADNTVKNGSVISFNNGAAYSNLSTLENRAIASYFGKSIKNPFKTAGVLNYRGLIEAAKNSGAVVFAVSGTSAAPIRDVFIRQFGFNFIGEVSVADPYKPRLLEPGVDWVDVAGTRKFVHAGLDVKDNVIPEYVQFLKRNEEGKVVAKSPAEVYADLDKTFSQAVAKAKDPGRVAVVLRPDIAELFKTYSKDFKGFQTPDLAKLERNKAAFEKGEYDQLILVGGPNMVFKFAPTLGTGEHMQKALGKATKAERISIQTYPGMQLKVQERGDVRALAEKNQASLERGDAEIAGLIGYAGLRGLEVYLNLYAGRSVRMDILDPQALPTEELTQLVGRLAYGRAGMLRERLFEGIVRPDEFVKSTALPEAMRDSLVQTLRDDARATASCGPRRRSSSPGTSPRRCKSSARRARSSRTSSTGPPCSSRRRSSRRSRRATPPATPGTAGATASTSRTTSGWTSCCRR